MRATGRIWIFLTTATALLAGCSGTTDGFRPRAKPDQLVVNFVQPSREVAGRGKLQRARISTKSGDIQILEPDGSVTEVALDGENRDPFMVSEADLMALNANLALDLSGMANLGPVKKRGPTAQEIALADFQARTQPLLPILPKGFKAEPEMFRGVTIADMRDPRQAGGMQSNLVSVKANLRRGVDADTAFAYATCALAGWAETNGSSYARHILTDQKQRNGEVEVDTVFTISKNRPMGLKVMNTDQTLQECKERGIPAT